MASYSLVQAITNASYMCDDGVGNLYVQVEDGVNTIIYQYNIATDTLTDISGATFNGHTSGSGSDGNPEWWDGNLYCVTGVWASNEVYVHRWNGGQSWTTVFTGNWSGVLTLSPILRGDGSRLAVIFGSTGYGRVDELWATTDGTTWNSQSYDGTYNFVLYYDESQLGELVLRRYRTTGTDYRMFAHSAGNTWADISGANIGTINFLGTEDTYQFFRSTGTTLYWSTDWGVTVNVIAGAWAFSEEACVVDLAYEVVGALGNSNDDVSFWNSGTTTFDIDGTPSAGNKVKRRPCYYNGYLYVLADNVGIYVRDDPIGPVITKDYAPSIVVAKSMDVSADDYYLYVGCLNGGNPVLLRLLADLTADPVAMYTPGAGTAIGVKCGDENDSWVWIGGDFGVPLVRLSIDDGASWTTKDPGTWNGVALPFVVGSWWDNLFLVPTDVDDDLHETEDGGLTWATLNAGLPFDVGGMDRLDINLDEMVIGSDAGRDISYSPNNGAAFEDVSDVAMSDVRITDVIVG